MTHHTSHEFNDFVSCKLQEYGGRVSAFSQDTGISLTDLIYTALYLRSGEFFSPTPDVHTCPFQWEITDQHITILRKFYVDSGFLKERICFLFNLNVSTSALFFKRLLGVTRTQGNAWRSPSRQEAKRLLIIEMAEAYNRVYSVWFNTIRVAPPRKSVIKRFLAKVFG